MPYRFNDFDRFGIFKGSGQPLVCGLLEFQNVNNIALEPY